MWPTLLVVYIPLQFLTISTYAAVFQLTAKSTSPDKLGKANGVGQTAAGFARMVGPILGSVSVAWSLKSGLPPPFDFHFVFWVLFPFLCCWPYALSRLLPASIDPIYSKKEMSAKKQRHEGNSAPRHHALQTGKKALGAATVLAEVDGAAAAL
jgi:MFS family permease